MGALDPATYAANVAALTARCDAQQFAISATSNTGVTWVPHVLQAVFRPVTPATAVVVAWSGTYKGTQWGDGFICDLSMQALALAALADHAKTVLDAVDLRRTAYGMNPVPGPDINMP